MTDAKEQTRLYRDIGLRVAEVRKRRGLTQEELGERAGLSTRAISDAERGSSCRMETYHAIARALDVETVYFVPRESSTPKSTAWHDEAREMVLVDWRSAITPALGQALALDEQSTLAELRMDADALAKAYFADRYDFVHQAAPAVIRVASYHVEMAPAHHRKEALLLRSDILHTAGRYLIQIREHDLATIALREAYRDAAAASEEELAAIIANTETRIMQRQARFREIESMCVALADRLEPTEDNPSLAERSAWGRSLLRAAAAASRNNRPTEAAEYLAAATKATEGLESDQMATGRLSFGPLTVGIIGPELTLMAGQPDKTLDLGKQLPATRGNIAATTPGGGWQQHMLYTASALCMTGQSERSTEVLHQLKLEVPEWLRSQRLAGDIVRSLLRSRKRTYLDTQRDLADFLALEI